MKHSTASAAAVAATVNATSVTESNTPVATGEDAGGGGDAAEGEPAAVDTTPAGSSPDAQPPVKKQRI